MSKSRFYEGEGFIFEHQRQLAIDILPQSFLMYSISIKVDGPSEVEVSCGEKRSRLTLTRGDMTLTDVVPGAGTALVGGAPLGRTTRAIGRHGPARRLGDGGRGGEQCRRNDDGSGDVSRAIQGFLPWSRASLCRRPSKMRGGNGVFKTVVVSESRHFRNRPRMIR